MLWWFAQTTLVAGSLAVVATLAGRWKRLGAEARHALWLVVLIKLAIPPFIAWPWNVPDAWPARVGPVPAPISVAIASPAPPVVDVMPAPDVPPLPRPDPLPLAGLPPSPEEVLADVEAPEASQIPAIPESRPLESKRETRAPAPEPQAPTSEVWNLKSGIWNLNSVLLALWLAGSVVVVARRGIKVVRFQRSLAGSRPAPDWLVEEARSIGERVGVRPPPVVATSSIGTPLLWCLGRPRLILPESLIKRLEADRWPGILAHELAHLARRDHWVVRLELLVEAVWWWNPLFWHARRRLHDEAEIACDARVVRSLPERRFAYAEALVDVCEHLARSAIPSPALGVGGAGASHSLEGRLHMILRDPIPGRPTRRGALAALLLAALALPAWTLGQQPEASKPEAPPSKPEAPPSKPDGPPSKPDGPPSKPEAPPSKFEVSVERSKPEAPPSAEHQYIKRLVPPIADLTIDDVRAGFAKRRQSLKNLAMRYVVASRSESSQGQDRRRLIQVEVADVIYGFAPGTQPVGSLVEGSRLDVFQAVAGSTPSPGEASPAIPWSRRLEIRMGGNVKSLRGDSKQKGPIPLRWRAIEPQPSIGEAVLGLFFTRDNSLLAGDVASLPTIYRPDLRPLVALDLFGPSPAIMAGVGVQFSGFAVDGMGGHEAVRIAWMSRGNGESRGLCWLAPGLDFAVVREEVAIDSPHGLYSANIKRWLWRKEAGDFTRFGDVWLPGKVKTILSEVDTDGQSKAAREQVVTLEDYRVNAESIAGAFRAEFPIQGLDEKTGDFTTVAPEPVPGLVARLERAVRESPFGPPLDEKIADEPKPVASRGLFQKSGQQQSKPGQAQDYSGQKPGQQQSKPGQAQDYSGQKPGQQPNKPGQAPADSSPSLKPGASQPAPPTSSNMPDGRDLADIIKEVDKAPIGRIAPKYGENTPARVIPAPDAAMPKQAVRPAPLEADAAKADPGIIARPAPGVEDPIPVAEPKVDDAISAKAPADQDDLDRMVERRFRVDPEVKNLAAQMMQAKQKLDDVRRLQTQPGDPAEQAAQRRLAALTSKYNRLWEAKSGEFREELSQGVTRARDEVDLLQIRLARKAADLQKVEAQRDMAKAVANRNERLKKQGPNFVSNEEVAKGEGELAVAEAEVASKKTERDEAELLLNQAKRRLGIATAARPGPRPEERKPSEIRDELAVDRDNAAQEGREEVGLLQARRDGKAADLQKAEAYRERAQQDDRRAQNLNARHAIGREEVDRITADLKVAEADVARKKADLEEADQLLGRAKRRLGAASTTPLGTSAASPGQGATLPDLRDAVELMEVQLQAKQAELRGVGSKVNVAQLQSARIKGLVDRGAVEARLGDETEEKVRTAQADLEVKKAEVLEFEVRLKQARRRLEAGEARLRRDAWLRRDASEAQLRRDIGRAKDRLNWSEEMMKKGFVSRASYLADRLTYDTYVKQMIQLDPTYVPALAPADVPASPILPPDPKGVPSQP